jgi:hypothetical protein
MDLPKSLVTILLFFLLTYRPYVDAASDDEDFFRTCSSHRCSKHGLDIRFPFRLSTHPPSCGVPGMQLSCSRDDTILDHHVLGPCKVTKIYYRHRAINVIPLVKPSHCPLQKLTSISLSTDLYKQPQLSDFTPTLVSCSRDFIPVDQYSIVGPASCLSNNNNSRFWYLASPFAYMSDLPRDCVAVSRSIPIPFTYDKHGPNTDKFNEIANRVIKFGETTFTWDLNNITDVCQQQCEHEGRNCGFSSQRGQAFCGRHGMVSFISRNPIL